MHVMLKSLGVALALLALAPAARAFSVNDPLLATSEIESLRRSRLSPEEFERQAVEYNIRMEELEAEYPDRFYNVRPKPGVATLVIDLCKTCRPQRLNVYLKQVRAFADIAISMADTRVAGAKAPVFAFRPGFMNDQIASRSAEELTGRPVYIQLATQINGGQYMFAASPEVQATSLGEPKDGPGVHVDREKIALVYALIRKYHEQTVIKVH